MDETGLTCDAITRDFRIWQRRRGHRYALDDVATAWEAASACPEAGRVLDLGCGIGSVLLMLAWKLPQARLWGIEAQPESAELARRSIADNGLGDRAEVMTADLRAAEWPHPPCDLVTGTPPYLPPGTALASPDAQRAAARIELRGGVEDYLAAASRVVAPAGRVVLCADGRRPERVVAGAAAAGLAPLVRRDVYPRAGAHEPLLALWVLGRTAHAPLCHEQALMRAGDGRRTPLAEAMRHTFGL